MLYHRSLLTLKNEPPSPEVHIHKITCSTFDVVEKYWVVTLSTSREEDRRQPTSSVFEGVWAPLPVSGSLVHDVNRFVKKKEEGIKSLTTKPKGFLRPIEDFDKNRNENEMG